MVERTGLEPAPSEYRIALPMIAESDVLPLNYLPTFILPHFAEDPPVHWVREIYNRMFLVFRPYGAEVSWAAFSPWLTPWARFSRP